MIDFYLDLKVKIQIKVKKYMTEFYLDLKVKSK